MSFEITAKGYDTDKNDIYLRNYHRYFNSLREKEISLLELGVFRGGSLLLWKDYFCKGSITGVDINPISLVDKSGRINIFQGQQQDVDFLDRVRKETAPDGFDIIIDDASHIGSLTRISFWHLFKEHLKDEGIYVIEDWRTGYWDQFVDGKQYSPPRDGSLIKDRLGVLLDKTSRSLINKSKGRWWLANIGESIRTCKNRYFKKRFPSHDYGMVGFVKELVDELGMDMITNPVRGGMGPQVFPKISRLEFCPGQVFVVKAPKQS